MMQLIQDILYVFAFTFLCDIHFPLHKLDKMRTNVLNIIISYRSVYKKYWHTLLSPTEAFFPQLLHFIFAASNFCIHMKLLLNYTKFNTHESN